MEAAGSGIETGLRAKVARSGIGACPTKKRSKKGAKNTFTGISPKGVE
jgi:hypothetical protein